MRKPKKRQRYVRNGRKGANRCEFPQRFVPAIIIAPFAAVHFVALGQAREEVERRRA